MVGIEHYRKLQIAQSIASLMPVSRCCIYDIRDDLVPTGHVVHNQETRWISPYQSYFHQIDPFAPHSILCKKGRRMHGTGSGTELFRLRKMEYYHEFMRPMGQDHKVEILLFGDSQNPVAGLRLSRTDLLGPFTAHEHALLENLSGLLDIIIKTNAATPALEDSLSPREAQVARLVAMGYMNVEVAAALNIRLPTVKSHLASIFSKYGVRNRAELVRRLK